ncbi:MAG: FmdB family zinc ribbon protein [Gemmatimonadales bacterium]
MPTYEFRCTKCQSLFNARMSVSEHGRELPACPRCGSRAVEQVLSAFYAKTVRKS